MAVSKPSAHALSQREYAIFKELVREHQRSFSGRTPPGVKHHTGRSRGRLFKITGSTRDGDDFKWTYTAVEVQWDGDFDYSTLTTAVLTLRNSVELNNNGNLQGMQSGIDLSDDDISGIEPVPTNTIVVCDAYRTFDGEGCWWFSYPNAPIISCGEGASPTFAFSTAFTGYFGDTGTGYGAFGGGGNPGSTAPDDIGDGALWEEPP